jgi:hypothetical protein
MSEDLTSTHASYPIALDIRIGKPTKGIGPAIALDHCSSCIATDAL